MAGSALEGVKLDSTESREVQVKLLGSGVGMDHSWSLMFLSSAFLPVPGILFPSGSYLGVKDGSGCP